LKTLFLNYQFSEDNILLPEEVRYSLSQSYKDKSKFQLRRMDDASEAFQAILDEINQSLKLNHIPVFDINVSEQTICSKCGYRGEPLVYTCSCWYLSVTELLVRHNQKKSESFESIFKSISDSEHKRCENNECGNCSVRKYVLEVPSVICIGLIWESDNIKASIQRELTQFLKIHNLKLSEMFDGIQTDQTASLVSLIGYYGKHYITILKDKSSNCWYLVDDAKYRKIGSDNTMIETILAWRLQISALFFEVSKLTYKPHLIPKTASPGPRKMTPKRRQSIQPTQLNFHDIDLEIQESNETQKLDDNNNAIVTNNDPLTEYPTTSSFGIIVEGSSPLSTFITSHDSYYCRIEERLIHKRSTEHHLELDKNLQLCIFITDISIIPLDKKILVYLKFSCDTNEEGEWMLFGGLNHSSQSCFLSIPACLHRYCSFIIMLKQFDQI
jgi:hypothetical protein